MFPLWYKFVDVIRMNNNLASSIVKHRKTTQADIDIIHTYCLEAIGDFMELVSVRHPHDKLLRKTSK